MGFIDNLKKMVANTVSLSDKAETLARIQEQTPANNGEASAYNSGGQYSPSNPLTPQHQGFNPWQYQYQVGSNLVITPRTEREGALLPFNVLRDVAANHDITALCIKMMIDQVCGDEWDIVVSDKNDREHYEDDIREVKKFFSRPDKVHLFNDWLKPLLYDCLSIDAATIFKRKTRGGKLYSLEYVDGATCKPLIDAYGRVPLPPYAAFQQIIFGYPYGSSDKPETKTLGFTVDEISYRPRYPRSYSRYGTSPIETILMKINIALRRDNMNLKYYTDGTTPDGGIYTFDKEDMTPDQIEQFATMYNDLMSGRLKERYKLKFLPKGKYFSTKEHKFDVQYDEWIARIVAIAFGVNPQQFIMIMNRSTGQLQDEQQTELGLAPLENFIAEWFTDIIQNDLGYPHLKFTYIGEKRQDAEMSIKRDVEFVQSGILTIDEVRSQRGMPPITGMPDGTPPMVKVGNDVILLTEEYIKAKTQAQIEALQYGNVQGGNQSDIENKIRQARAENPEAAETPKGDAEPKDTEKAACDELRDFRRYVVNRLKKKSRGKRRFEAKLIPCEIVDEIYARLEKAETVESIDDIFSDAEWEIKVESAKNETEEELNALFDDLQQEIIENLEGVTEEDMQTSGSAKKYILLLLLLGGTRHKERIDALMQRVLERYARISLEQASDEIRRLGGKLTSSERKEIADKAIKERMDFLSKELNRVTEERLGNLFVEAESIADVVAGISENYALSQGRAKIIANTEFHNMQNEIVVSASEKSDSVAAIFITDGVNYDEPCIDANGSLWSVEYAKAHPLQHVNCRRVLHPVGHKFVEEYGGIDEK